MANLVLNGKSIDSIDDIAENFVEEDVLREFRSGSLASWLEEDGYEEELERVRSIKPTASSIRVLAGISEALNLDDDVIAEAAARREEQRRKEEAIRKAREEQQRIEEEEKKRNEEEDTKILTNDAIRRELEKQQNDEASGQLRKHEGQQRKVDEAVVCQICGYVYNPIDNNNIPFMYLPCDWSCPICGIGKDQFEEYFSESKIQQCHEQSTQALAESTGSSYASAPTFSGGHFIDPEKCVGCGACKEVCPVDAISEVNGTCMIDASLCVACGACAGFCPVEAIRG